MPLSFLYLRDATGTVTFTHFRFSNACLPREEHVRVNPADDRAC